MYPVRLEITGIRDFAPRRLDLGGSDDHVLIGGKNGSGKSTLVFALAFALGSPRVSVDGLRSKLRRAADGWRARVAVLFHNPPGENKKDAPEYVELAAEVRLAPGAERRQVRYTLSGGELPDRLALLRQFQTRSEAQDYYKRVFDIDAEGYFMFWYQGSIAEFANISDAARFERVAVMFGLDELQREWELARREMKEAEEDFERARTVALARLRRLQELEKLKNALEHRDALRRDALLQLDVTCREMIRLIRGEEEALRQRLAETRRELAAAGAECAGREKVLRELNGKLGQGRERRALQQEELSRINADLGLVNRRLEAWFTEQAELSKRVRDLEEKMKHVHRSREELLKEQGSLERDRDELNRTLAELDGLISALEEQQTHSNRELGAAQQELSRVKDELVQKKRLQAELPPAYALQAEEAALKQERDALVQAQGHLAEKRERLEQEQNRLAGQKTLLLPEQEKILNAYRQAGIRAAAFGELFDVREGVDRQQVESWLAPLKHTIFVERLLERIPVEKGFYVVPLPAVRRRSWLSVSGRRSNLFDYLVSTPGADCPESFFSRVEHWLANVELRFEPGAPEPAAHLVLWNGTLWDQFGLRGAVEPGAAIGVRALEEARRRVAEELAAVEAELAEQESRRREKEARLQEVVEKLTVRREVDRVLPGLQEKKAALEVQLAALAEDLHRVNGQLAENRRLRQIRHEELTRKEMALKQVEGELALWAEYEREQETIARLKELARKIAEAKTELEQKRSRSDQLDRELDQLAREIRILEQEVQAAEGEWQRAAGRVEQIEKSVGELEEQAGALSIEAEEWEKKYADLQEEHQAVIAGLIHLGQWTPPVYQAHEKTRANLQRKEMEARARLDDALSRPVNENARQDYNDYAYEYEQAQKEFQESKLRFEQLRAREEERRQDFHKAVTYRLQRTNQRFTDFMQRLGMAGEIRLVEPEEDSRHPTYQWELWVATRPGHRPEKIFPESGRIVGEGISGGERAATSLVFALALLSDIEKKPPFYVLDEFDSNLDEERKHDIFDLYYAVLNRKLIIISPKVHGDQYLNRFHKFLCVVANPGVQPGQQISEVYEVTRERYREVVVD
ncbi:MAG: AAA family ATPase [Bacillota bacterium]